MERRGRLLTIVIVVLLVVMGVTVFFAKVVSEEDSWICAGGCAPSGGEAVAAYFDETGTVVRHDPEMRYNPLHFIYEEPGAPALDVELSFTASSTCGVEGGAESSCALISASDYGFTQGSRARIIGSRLGTVVTVARMLHASSSSASGIPVKLYFYDPIQDQGPGGSQCSEQGLVGVERIIPSTKTPLTDTVSLLLRGEISDEERAQGITSEFPLRGVALVDAAIDRGVATLTFNDPFNVLSGGSCRVAILWKEIEATARQFAGVTAVRFSPEYLFQP